MPRNGRRVFQAKTITTRRGSGEKRCYLDLERACILKEAIELSVLLQLLEIAVAADKLAANLSKGGRLRYDGKDTGTK